MNNKYQWARKKNEEARARVDFPGLLKVLQRDALDVPALADDGPGRARVVE